MDGAPLITQCPIPSYTTFQYKFRASAPGTHLYHAYSDSDRSKGLFGALIVRQPERKEPHKNLYDSDLKEHVILIHEIQGKIRINGGSLVVFNVTQGLRYRFRVASLKNDPVKMSIVEHKMRVIALDGNPVMGDEAQSIVFSKGERVDFVLKANKRKGSYPLRVESNGIIEEGLALVSYNGKNEVQTEISFEEGRNLDTALCQEQNNVCLGNIRSLDKIKPELGQLAVNKIIYLAFGPRKFDFHDGN